MCVKTKSQKHTKLEKKNNISNFFLQLPYAEFQTKWLKIILPIFIRGEGEIVKIHHDAMKYIFG